MHPIDELRKAVNYFGYWNETFNQQWNTDQLLAIYRFAVSPQGSMCDEDPTTWDEETICKALGIPFEACENDAECVECGTYYPSDSHPTPTCETCR